MSAERINYLIRQYAGNMATEAEIEELFAWFRLHRNEEELQVHLEMMAATTQPDQQYAAVRWEPFIQEIFRTKVAPVKSVNATTVKPVKKEWWKYAAAAAVIVGFVTTAVLLIKENNVKQPVAQNPQATPSATDVRPGKNGAVLTLADGRQVLLDSAGNGLLATQGSTAVVIQNGRLVYDVTAKNNEVFYNTMTTPYGRTYRLVLPDGSQVWLNAASSITFPTAFSNNERSVNVTGEAYFEIAKDAKRPFKVHCRNQQIEVLGTSFNINAYDDEPIKKTTLITGSIRVTPVGAPLVGARNLAIDAGRVPTRGTSTETLQPNEQIQIAGTNSIKIITLTNPSDVIAWKNGAFNFHNAGLKEVMRQLARWYNLEVIYEKNVPDVRFGGEMSRNILLSDLLKGLKDMEVHFRLEEGRKLIVTP